MLETQYKQISLDQGNGRANIIELAPVQVRLLVANIWYWEVWINCAPTLPSHVLLDQIKLKKNQLKKRRTHKTMFFTQGYGCSDVLSTPTDYNCIQIPVNRRGWELHYHRISIQTTPGDPLILNE